MNGCCVYNWGISVPPVQYIIIENCEGWWLSSCHSSVEEHWLHKPGALGSLPVDCQLFHFFTSHIYSYSSFDVLIGFSPTCCLLDYTIILSVSKKSITICSQTWVGGHLEWINVLPVIYSLNEPAILCWVSNQSAVTPTYIESREEISALDYARRQA